MKWTRRLTRRIRIVLGKEDVERELDVELRHHIELETEDLVRRGMDPDGARREAMRRFGGVDRTKERVRDERGGRVLDDFVQDLRYGARSLRRSPGFTASALIVLALGIGAAVSLFAVVDAVLLESLPYPSADRLVRVWPASPSRGIDRASFSYMDFRDWRERSRTLDGLAVYTTLPGDYIYLGGDGPSELTTEWVAGDFFDILGVPPVAGRTLTFDDAEEGRMVAVISHGLWQRLFGADPSVVGSVFTLDHRSFQIVGVMPAGFSFPEGEPVEVWLPLTVIPEDDIPISVRPVRFLQALGRLAPGATPATAQDDLGAVARELEQTYPDSNAGVSAATVMPLRDWMVGDVRTSLWVALGAVGLILLLACSNVANLLLARGTARSREVALRMSLGAPAGRIVRQLLTESLLLSLLGGAAGLGLAWVATRGLATGATDLLPRASDISMDGTVLAVSLALGLVAAGFAGILPALRAADVSPANDLRGGGRDGSTGPAAVRLRRVLVGAEVALAVLLLTGAGLLLRSLSALGDVDPGFETGNRIAMTITISDQKHPERADWQALYHEILDRLDAHPDAVAAGAIRRLPFRGSGEALPVWIAGVYEPAPDEQRYGEMYMVSDGLFDALGMRLLRGRGIERTDGAESGLVAVVNEAFQQDFFQDQDPVGRRFALSSDEDAQQVEIVGIVADVRHDGLGQDPGPTLYVSNDQVPRIQMSYVVQTEGDPMAIVPDLRRIVRELDPDQPISEIVPLDDLMAEDLARPRFFTSLLGGFAVMALVLAALGVYGVLAYVVRSQIRETGLRLALGASSARVARGVVAQGMLPVAVGLALGLLGAAGLTGLLRSMLFGVQPLDTITFVGVAFVLALAALIACTIPAWFASRVDPMVSIRAE